VKLRAFVAFACVALGTPPKATGLERPESKDPQQNYVLFCAGCHTLDGSGAAHRVPSLRETLPQFMRVAGGRDYLTHVPGVANSQLSAAAVAEVMNWCSQRFAPELVASGWAPYTADEIASARRTPQLSIKRTRRALVELTSIAAPPAGSDY